MTEQVLAAGEHAHAPKNRRRITTPSTPGQIQTGELVSHSFVASRSRTHHCGPGACRNCGDRVDLHLHRTRSGSDVLGGRVCRGGRDQRPLFCQRVERLRRAGLHLATRRRACEVQRDSALRGLVQGDAACHVDERPARNRLCDVHRALYPESGSGSGEADDRAPGRHPIGRAWLLCPDGARVVGPGDLRLSLQVECGGRCNRLGAHDRSRDLHDFRRRDPELFPVLSPRPHLRSEPGNIRSRCASCSPLPCLALRLAWSWASAGPSAKR